MPVAELMLATQGHTGFDLSENIKPQNGEPENGPIPQQKYIDGRPYFIEVDKEQFNELSNYIGDKGFEKLEGLLNTIDHSLGNVDTVDKRSDALVNIFLEYQRSAVSANELELNPDLKNTKRGKFTEIVESILQQYLPETKYNDIKHFIESGNFSDNDAAKALVRALGITEHSITPERLQVDQLSRIELCKLFGYNRGINPVEDKFKDASEYVEALCKRLSTLPELSEERITLEQGKLLPEEQSGYKSVTAGPEMDQTRENLRNAVLLTIVQAARLEDSPEFNGKPFTDQFSKREFLEGFVKLMDLEMQSATQNRDIVKEILEARDDLLQNNPEYQNAIAVKDKLQEALEKRQNEINEIDQYIKDAQERIENIKQNPDHNDKQKEELIAGIQKDILAYEAQKEAKIAGKPREGQEIESEEDLKSIKQLKDELKKQDETIKNIEQNVNTKVQKDHPEINLNEHSLKKIEEEAKLPVKAIVTGDADEIHITIIRGNQKVVELTAKDGIVYGPSGIGFNMQDATRILQDALGRQADQDKVNDLNININQQEAQIVQDISDGIINSDISLNSSSDRQSTNNDMIYDR